MRRTTSRVRATVLALAGALLLGGCDVDVYSLPLPGGTDTGDDPMKVTVKFTDVLDLVPQSTVKVNDVNVGKVTEVALDGSVAAVTLELRRDVELPDNAVAELRQTSLLGEKFVSLAPPETGASGNTLADGDVIPLDRSGRNPEVEEVLGALSLLLNGGGVAQLKTISSEINNALEGREGSAKSLLSEVRLLMRQLDDNKADIIEAIEALNRLSIEAGQHLDTLDAALDELPSAIDSLDRQRDDLVRMLRALDDLSGVGVRVIQASKTATIDSLEQLDPVLTQLAAAGDDVANAFSLLTTYPFVDETVGRDPQVARNLHMGDYTNLSVQLDINLDVLPTLPTILPTLPTLIPTLPTPTLPTLVPTSINPTELIDDVIKCIQSGSLASPECQKVLSSVDGIAKLKEECQKPENRDTEVCKQLNQIPLPTPTPPLPTPTIIPTSGGPIPTITVSPSLPLRAPPLGQVPAYGPRGPTVAELMDVYDPALVSLLVPGLVSGPVPSKGGVR